VSAGPTETPGTRVQALDGARLLAGLGALILLVSLFLNWWGPSADAIELGNRGGISAWNVFELVDIVLAGLALAVLAGSIEAVSRPGRSRLPTGLSAAAGPLAVALIVVSLINDPPLVRLAPDSSVEIGAWMALAGALLITLGGLLRYARVSINVTPREPAASDTQTQPLSREPGPPPR